MKLFQHFLYLKYYAFYTKELESFILKELSPQNPIQCKVERVSLTTEPIMFSLQGKIFVFLMMVLGYKV